jgi:pimeloyl-ACP methyl ester carboxylesterase
MMLDVLRWLSLLVAFGLLLFVAVALLSPLETLGWWAGWSRRQDEAGRRPPVLPDHWLAEPASYYVVYLTGIGGFSGEFLGRREIGFLQQLQEHLPNAIIVHDVFPFSATNNPLDGDRFLSRLWGWLQQRRLRKPQTVFKNLISIRNILQVAVSADPRYGPIYNVGVAQEIVRSLLEKGYPPGRDKAITLIGVSGGGQVALGTARYLQEALQVPIYVISIGGVLSDDPGIAHVEHLYHLHGSRDNVPRLAELLYPGRWPFLSYSAWNKAKREGKITVIDPGPMTHMGPEEYFSRSALLADGRSHAEATADLVAGLITGSHQQLEVAGATQALPAGS